MFHSVFYPLFYLTRTESLWVFGWGEGTESARGKPRQDRCAYSRRGWLSLNWTFSRACIGWVYTVMVCEKRIRESYSGRERGAFALQVSPGAPQSAWYDPGRCRPSARSILRWWGSRARVATTFLEVGKLASKASKHPPCLRREREGETRDSVTKRGWG